MTGRTILILLTTIFMSTEIFFNYLVLTDGDGDLTGATIKTVFFLLLILLFSKRLQWAKWILSVSLILYGLLCILLGMELMATFYFIGLYHIFFGVYIHKSDALAIFRQDKTEPDLAIQNTDDSNSEVLAFNQGQRYPSLVKRYKALLIDGLLILFTLIMIMVIVDDTSVRTPIMVSSAIIILLAYEPLLTSYSRTLGQRLMRIKVGRYSDPGKRITLINAYLRWIVKGLLGWISFISIHFNNQRRAIHDLASDSVMIEE